MLFVDETGRLMSAAGILPRGTGTLESVSGRFSTEGS